MATDLALDFSEHWKTWNAKQAEFMAWDSPGLSVEAFLGSWGLGKTKGVARKFIYRCLQNPWHKAYGNAQPKAAVCAPTNKVLAETTIPALMEELPPELILRKRVAPPYIDLVNGVRILLVSAEATLEGVNLCTFWIDEISHHVFSSNPNIYINYLARLRDKKATKRAMLVSGLPLAGWVRENFDFENDGIKNVTVRGGIEDNFDCDPSSPTYKEGFIPDDVKEQILAACPSGQEGMLVYGKWGLPPGATFPMFDTSTHLTGDQGDELQPVHVGIDIGNHGAVVIAQERRFDGRNVVGGAHNEKGLLICDQILTEFESLENALYKLKMSKWNVMPGRSSIMLDPTVRQDELNHVYKMFPGVHVVVRRRGDDFYSVDNGLHHLQACLKDALGNIRIKITNHLSRTKYGVVEALQMARGRNNLLMIKDDSRDHVICATRYLVCELLQPRSGSPRFVG